MRKHRPRILTFLSFGAGGTIGTAIVYIFTPSFLEKALTSDGDIGPVGWILIWWLVSGFGAFCLGLFQTSVPKSSRNEDG